MNTKTGAIATFESDLDAKRAGFDLRLTEAQAERLLPMPRDERLAVVAPLIARRRFKVRQRQSR